MKTDATSDSLLGGESDRKRVFGHWIRSVRMTRKARIPASPQSEPTVGAEVIGVTEVTDWSVSPRQAELSLIIDELRRLTEPKCT